MKILIYLLVIMHSQCILGQYELSYEFLSNDSPSPYKIKEIWYKDTSWTYIYFGDDFIYESKSEDGSHVSYVKKINHGYGYIMEILKIPEFNKMYLMETVLWNDEHVNFSFDEYYLMQFDLVDSTKMIDSLHCHLARTTHRCKDYDIWFTYEVPIPTGPWKFHGLPGAIVSVESTDGKVIMELKGISPTKKKINSVFNRFNIDVKQLEHWRNQKSDYEKFAEKLIRKGNECNECPPNVTSKAEVEVLECFK